MFRTLAAVALAAAVPAPLMADYTECKVIHNGPIQSNKTEQPFQRQPDTAASTLYPKTFIFDGMPPERMRGPAVVTVSTGSIADCGIPAPGAWFEACTRNGVIHTDNPCDHPDQSYARLLCHEVAHTKGWPADHGE